MDRIGRHWTTNDTRYTFRGMAFWVTELWHLSITAAYSQNLSFGNDSDHDLPRIAQVEEWGFIAEDMQGRMHAINVAISMAVLQGMKKQRPELYNLHAAMHSQIMVAIQQLGDALIHTGLHEKVAKEPCVQFLRHLRNAFAHGGYWSFDTRTDFGKRPAGISSTALTVELQGHSVWDGFRVGDYAILMSELNLLLHRHADEAGEPFQGPREFFQASRY